MFSPASGGGGGISWPASTTNLWLSDDFSYNTAPTPDEVTDAADSIGTVDLDQPTAIYRPDKATLGGVDAASAEGFTAWMQAVSGASHPFSASVDDMWWAARIYSPTTGSSGSWFTLGPAGDNGAARMCMYVTANNATWHFDAGDAYQRVTWSTASAAVNGVVLCYASKTDNVQAIYYQNTLRASNTYSKSLTLGTPDMAKFRPMGGAAFHGDWRTSKVAIGEGTLSAADRTLLYDNMI